MLHARQWRGHITALGFERQAGVASSAAQSTPRCASSELISGIIRNVNRGPLTARTRGDYQTYAATSSSSFGA